MTRTAHGPSVHGCATVGRRSPAARWSRAGIARALFNGEAPMDRRRLFAVLPAAALLVVAGVAPASAAGPKGKVVIWYDSGAAWNPFITDFNKQLAAQYPDITVEWVTQDPAQLSAKLVA